MRDEFQIKYYRNSSEVYGVCDDANYNLSTTVDYFDIFC